MKNNYQTNNIEKNVKAYNMIPQRLVGDFPIVPLSNGLYVEFKPQKGFKAFLMGNKESNVLPHSYVGKISDTAINSYFDRPVVPSETGELVYFEK